MRKTALALVVGLLAWTSTAQPVCIGDTCYLSEEAARAAGVSEEQIAAALAAGAHDDAQASDSVALKKLIQAVDAPQPPVDDATVGKPVAAPAVEAPLKPRVAFGYMDAPKFLEFLTKKTGTADAKEPAKSQAENTEEPANVLANASVAMAFLLVLLGGLAMNLTPCVLPLVPVSLVLVGRGWARGAAYGLGMALSYGALGLAAAFGGLMFGTIQSSPWFNLAVAVVFLVLGLAASGVFFIDFSKFRPRPKTGGNAAAQGGLVGPFLLGAGTAVLAGACVAPFLIATLVQTATWFGEGRTWAVVLPFVFGAGMGLPWPFAAAGMKVLPKPGAWMPWVNRVFAVMMFGMAFWYGWSAWKSWQASSPAASSPTAQAEEGRFEATPTAQAEEGRFEATPATWKQTFDAAKATGKPVFVDVWATWCKNCLAMEKTTFKNDDVRKALEHYAVIRLQAEKPNELMELPEFKDLNIMGLPAFVVFEPERPAEAPPAQ